MTESEEDEIEKEGKRAQIKQSGTKPRGKPWRRTELSETDVKEKTQLVAFTFN